jgi:hypothetical protein
MPPTGAARIAEACPEVGEHGGAELLDGGVGTVVEEVFEGVVHFGY